MTRFIIIQGYQSCPNVMLPLQCWVFQGKLKTIPLQGTVPRMNLILMLIFVVLDWTGKCCGLQVKSVKCHHSNWLMMPWRRYPLPDVVQYGHHQELDVNTCLLVNNFFSLVPHCPNHYSTPNQFQAFGIEVNDNPFDSLYELRMDFGEVFVPFNTMGTVVHFKLRAPMDKEIKHLPWISISGDQWNPTDNSIFPEHKTWEQIEIHTIKSLTSGMTKCDVKALRLAQAKAQVEEYGEVKHKLGKILPV